MLKEFFLFSLGLILIIGGIYCFFKSLKMGFRYYKLRDFNKTKDYNLRFPLKDLFNVITCLAISLLDLGDTWPELIIRIISCFCLFNFTFPLWYFFSESVVHSNLRFKRYLYISLLLIWPLIIYLGGKIYFINFW